jgi:hypothetical protein
MILTLYSGLAYAQQQPGPAAPEAPAQAPAEEARPEAAPEAAAPEAQPSVGKSALVTTFLWITFLLGLWLLVSPWVMAGEKASLKWNTTITGLIVALLSLIAALS